MHTKMHSEEFYAGLDDGIRFAVRVLHARGINTGQSCQGGDGHCYELPTVDLWEETATAGFAAFHILREYGLPVWEIQRVWRAHGDELVEPLTRITFAHSLEDRKDDRPPFEWSYVGV